MGLDHGLTWANAELRATALPRYTQKVRVSNLRRCRLPGALFVISRDIEDTVNLTVAGVAVYRREHAGEEPPLSVTDRARLREVERENRELKMENDFLKKAAAYFARDHR